WRVRRWKGAGFTIAAVLLPPLCALLVDVRIQLLGVWDALYVGLAAGTGLLLAMHQDFADSKSIALLVGTCVAGVFALEVASRFVLPPPPAFPSGEGPTLFLSELLRFTPARAFSTTQAGISTCYALYGSDQSAPKNWGATFPDSWHPRADA